MSELKDVRKVVVTKAISASDLDEWNAYLTVTAARGVVAEWWKAMRQLGDDTLTRLTRRGGIIPL